MRLFYFVLLFIGMTLPLQGQSLKELVGNTPVGNVSSTSVLNVPYITWGGDVATFYANGGLKTQSGSIFNQLGLNINLEAGDDPVKQVKDYLSGRSPFLRMTMRQLGQVSEIVGTNPKTKPVVLFQLTWSVGDHMVADKSIKELSQLKGKTIAVQEGGPHLDLVDDGLHAVNLDWDDVTIVWCKNLTGKDSPAEKLRNGEADAACVISPDMLALTGGLDSVGTGAEGTLEDARVLVSTAQMSRSIPDVYIARSDFFNANRALCEKFTAGYFKACEELVQAQKEYNSTGKSPKYLGILKLAQNIYGKEILPTIEIDAHGLVSDCTFVRIPGNQNWFDDPGITGFNKKMASALDLAIKLKVASNRFGFSKPNFDYKKISNLAGLPYVAPKASSGRIQGEIEMFTEELDNNTILSFVIEFEPNQNDFSADTYGADFKQVIENAAMFGNAVFAVRGHSDPTATVKSLLLAGMQKGIITRTGNSSTGYKYFLRGQEMNLEQTDNLIREIQSGNFVGAADDPNVVMQSALNLSLSRAEAVKKAIIEYSKNSGINLDASQIQPQGVGIREPVFPKPTSMSEAKKNMRVEFRLIKVPAEALQESDFDF